MEFLAQKHPARFRILALYSLAAIMNSVGWLTFASIHETVFDKFKPSRDPDFLINSLAAIYMIVFVPINFLSIWVIEKVGLRASINIGVSF